MGYQQHRTLHLPYLRSLRRMIDTLRPVSGSAGLIRIETGSHNYHNSEKSFASVREMYLFKIKEGNIVLSITDFVDVFVVFTED